MEALLLCTRVRYLFEQLVLANPGSAVRDKLYTSNLAYIIGQDNIFLTVAAAVADFAPKRKRMRELSPKKLFDIFCSPQGFNRLLK